MSGYVGCVVYHHAPLFEPESPFTQLIHPDGTTEIFDLAKFEEGESWKLGLQQSCEFWVKKYRETGTSFFEFHPYRREYGIVPNWHKEKTKWLCVQVELFHFDKKTSAKHCVADHKGLSDFHIGMAYGFQKKYPNIPLW